MWTKRQTVSIKLPVTKEKRMLQPGHCCERGSDQWLDLRRFALGDLVLMASCKITNLLPLYSVEHLDGIQNQNLHHLLYLYKSANTALQRSNGRVAPQKRKRAPKIAGTKGSKGSRRDSKIRLTPTECQSFRAGEFWTHA